MKRLLCILNNMNAGGAETFLMKLYRNIDRTRYQFDFCINVKEKCFYEEEIIALGGKIYRIPSKSENMREFRKQLGKLIKEKKYSYVLRITSNTMGLMDLKIAKKAGAEVCCARSSNSSDGGAIKAKIAHIIGRCLYMRYVDVALAPSDLAVAYTFGRKMYKKGKVHILHNAVDLDYFSYNAEARRMIRNEWNISPSTKVIGHIGRFMEQKNHLFLLKVFEVMHKMDRDTILMLVGEGELKESIQQKAMELGIIDKVIFAGIRKDIPAVLSAMDIFVFPSYYEGMPNTVIEAQATGLPCVIADTITREAQIINSVKYMSLSASVEEWAEVALNSVVKKRNDTRQIFLDKKYDVQSSVEDFMNIVFD